MVKQRSRLESPPKDGCWIQKSTAPKKKKRWSWHGWHGSLELTGKNPGCFWISNWCRLPSSIKIPTKPNAGTSKVSRVIPGTPNNGTPDPLMVSGTHTISLWTSVLSSVFLKHVFSQGKSLRTDMAVARERPEATLGRKTNWNQIGDHWSGWKLRGGSLNNVKSHSFWKPKKKTSTTNSNELNLPLALKLS